MRTLVAAGIVREVGSDALKKLVEIM